MRFNREYFWNGFGGCMFAIFVVALVVALFVAAIDHGRFLAAQDCIERSEGEAGARACLTQWKAGRR